MFKNRKRINEYKRISNSVRLPELKSREKNFEVRRSEKMNRKAIASGLVAAVICSAVILTNVGTNFNGAENERGSLVVYATENKGDTKQIFEKGKEIAINTVAVINEKDNEYNVRSGAQLGFLSKDIKRLKLNTNKGEFMKELPIKNDSINISDENIGIIEMSGEKYVEDNKKTEKTCDYNISKDGKSIEVTNIDSEVLGVNWALSPEMEKLKDKKMLDKKTVGEVEINITAEFKDGKTKNETIILSVNDSGTFVGKMK